MRKTPISEMSDEELRAELARLQSLPAPAERKAAVPKRKRDAKPKARKASWRDALFGTTDESHSETT